VPSPNYGQQKTGAARAAKRFTGIRTDSLIKQVKPALHFTTAKDDYSAFTGMKYKEEAILTQPNET